MVFVYAQLSKDPVTAPHRWGLDLHDDQNLSVRQFQ